MSASHAVTVGLTSSGACESIAMPALELTKRGSPCEELPAASNVHSAGVASLGLQQQRADARSCSALNKQGLFKICL